MSSDQGRSRRHALGVDFGTSNTVAVARWPDGRARPILVDGSPLLPSAVYAEPDGQLIVGRDAVHSARLEPARFEPNPKRRIDDGTVLLGDHELPVVDLIAAVLARVAEEWHRAVGPVRPDVTLTCPATWGAARRGLLAEAAARAGLTGARLVAEPVAAATYFAEVLGRDVPIGSVVVVHDFGAGTFDASVVARTGEGFEVMAVDGRDDIGGLDVDAAIVEHLGAYCAERDAAAWQRLVEPTTVEERRAQRQLWDDVRVAKERLSRTQAADLVVPLLGLEVHLTRDELEALARPVLEQTVRVTAELLRWADLPEGRLAGVFLVGGASRIPLVATLLHRALGEAPVVIEQPELVVAEGSILADAALLAAEPAAPGPTAEIRLMAARRAEATRRSAGVDDAETVLSGLRPPAGVDDAETVLSGSRPPAGVDDAETVLSGSRSPAGAGDAETVLGSRSPGDVDDAETVLSRPRPSAGVDDAETVRSGPRGADLPPPAVDPWPHADPGPWVPDPDATVACEPTPLPGPATRPLSPAAGRASASTAPTRPPSRSRSGTTRAMPTATRAKRSADPVSSAARPVVGAVPPASPPQPPASKGRRKPAPAPERRRPRRRSRFVRFLQFLLSAAVLLAAPVAALVVVYAMKTDQSVRDAAYELARDAYHLFRQWSGGRTT
ncbi:Hsp70 family protein [Krasilnikovia sp. MM14-A1004]|uniref:Hsp70 family protein n=1 Tax=Krasilnikovia sp. MM14-A1004 TaxID=3373541 RepID=UPI00399CF0B1